MIERIKVNGKQARFWRKSALAAAVMAACGLSYTAGAQQAAAPAAANSDALEEVVVTAERRSADVQTTPISMETLSASEISKSQMITVTDLQSSVANLQVLNAGLFRSINIRGVGNSVVNPSIATGIAVFHDQLFQPETIGLLLPFYDIADVEVLRGPQGTFIGQSSTGGAVLIRSRNPSLTEGITGYVDTQFGTYNDRKYTGGINLPVNDTLAVRLAFSDQHRNSFYKDVGAILGGTYPVKPFVDPGQIDQRSERIGVLWKPTDNFQALLKVEYNRSDTNGTPDTPNQNTFVRADTGAVTHSPFYQYQTTHQPFIIEDNVPNREDIEVNNLYGLEMRYTLPGDAVLRSMTTYQHNDVTQVVDLDATNANYQVQDHTIGPNNNYRGQEITIQSPDGGKLTWIGGLSYFRRQTPVILTVFSLPVGVTVPSPNVVLTPLTMQSNGAVTKTEGAFGQVTYQLTPEWQGQFGLRDNSDNNYNYGLITQPRVPRTIPNTGSYKKSVPTFKAGVNFTPEALPNQYLYAFYARGYKSGGINNSVVPNFAPEHVDDYEIGLKSKFFNDHIQTSIGGYYMNYKNLQQPVLSKTSGTNSIVNLGTSTIDGIEGNIKGRFGGLDVALDAAYNHSKLGSINAIAGYELGPASGSLGPQCAAGQATGCFNYVPFYTNLSGEQNPYAPKVTANFTVDYGIPVGDYTLRPRVQFSHTDKQFASIFQNSNYFLLGARNLLNVSLIYDAGPWEAQAYANNVTNELYISGYSGNQQYYGNPQEFGVRFSRTF